MPTTRPESAEPKALHYEALGDFNRNFEQLLGTLGRLKGLLQPDLCRALRVALEETRAWSNLEIVERLQEREQREWGLYGRLRRKREKKYEDPNDVLLETAQRKKSRKDRWKRPRAAVKDRSTT